MSHRTESLEHVYGARTPEETRAAYDGWAAAYDRDCLSKGYRLPGMAAAYVARHVADRQARILDAGCGTGLVGEALAVMGYDDITGTDLSPEMLKLARSRGAYRDLFPHRLGRPLPQAAGSFDAITCFGSFGPGHAPPETLDDFIRLTRRGGRIIFNVRHDSWEEQGLKAHVEALEAAGRWRILDRSAVFRAFALAEPEVTVQVLVAEPGR